MEGQVSLFGPESPCGKMCPAPIAAGHPAAATIKRSSRRSSTLRNHTFMWLNLRADAGNMLGPCWEKDPAWLGSPGMLNTSECPKNVVESFLSQILEAAAPSKYSLSRKACLGILRRSDARGKPLPPALERALLIQAELIPPCELTPEPRHTFAAGIVSKGNGECFLIPERHTALGGGGGQAGQGYPCVLTTECLNPWDTQQARVFTPDSVAPTMAGADGKGGRNPCGLVFTAGFCAGAGASAGGIGYQEEVAPTLKGTPSGNMMPTVLCLNDQGGQLMEVTENVAGTLRAQEHGHQPLVLYDNHGKDARYTGPHEVAPTLSARAGTGGGNLPIVEDRTFARNRVDRFVESDTASTVAARQYKDATDLVGQRVEADPGEEENAFCRRCMHRNECGMRRVMLLRRLMPVECERLQGYPSGWTGLPGAKDSPRYRSLGNSVAVPCVDHLMHCVALAILADR